MTDWVKDWLDDPASNYGLRLRFGNANVGAAFDDTADFAPRLIVTSVIPEPASAVLVLLGFGAVGSRVRRRMGMGWPRRRRERRD